MRLVALEKNDGAYLELERERLVVETVDAVVGGRMLEVEEPDWIKLDVEVADVTVDALELLEAEVGGRKVELIEAGLLSGAVDAVEADRSSWDIVVVEVTVEARITEALGFFEAALAVCPWRILGAVDEAGLLR